MNTIFFIIIVYVISPLSIVHLLFTCNKARIERFIKKRFAFHICALACICVYLINMVHFAIIFCILIDSCGYWFLVIIKFQFLSISKSISVNFKFSNTLIDWKVYANAQNIIPLTFPVLARLSFD